MLEVELDIFSGRPNPTWILSEKDEQELLDRVIAEPEQLSPVDSPDELFGLGYRGFIVRHIKEDDGPWSQTNRPSRLRFPAGLTTLRRGSLPMEFRVGSKPMKGGSAAEWLLRTSERRGTQVTDTLREVASEGVTLVPVDSETFEAPAPSAPSEEVPGGVPTRVGPKAQQWHTCNLAYYTANVAFFNGAAYVRRNNCYCFAANHRANVRVARPGRRAGRPARSFTCASMLAGLRADGWRDVCPRAGGLTIAMVIWPGHDYHFYRLVSGSPTWLWGHKPGGTPARYTDNRGRVINRRNRLGPKNCARGPYTAWCGYFYQNNNNALVA